MANEKQRPRSVVQEARKLGLEFDFEVDPKYNGALVLVAGDRRHSFVSNAALMYFLDGVRTGKALAAAEAERLTELADRTGLEDDC